jgi:hypothetical protein
MLDAIIPPTHTEIENLAAHSEKAKDFKNENENSKLDLKNHRRVRL